MITVALRSLFLSFKTNFYVRCFSIMVATCLSDFVWAGYMGSVASGRALVAANWASLVIVLGAFVVVSYVQDKRLILPAAVGAWVGTYLGV